MIASILGFIGLFGLVLLRVPIAFAMIVVGTVGYAMLRSWDSAFRLAGNAAFDVPLSFTLAVIPLFILMGNLAGVSGMSRDLYDAAHSWFGHLKGGLASATIVGCAGFSNQL
jgi:TRAP-type mannitol/chloroaromatic compound transport system permease large subunit